MMKLLAKFCPWARKKGVTKKMTVAEIIDHNLRAGRLALTWEVKNE
jgi:hypothetical protein